VLVVSMSPFGNDRWPHRHRPIWVSASPRGSLVPPSEQDR
jgi:hypothetical protein